MATEKNYLPLSPLPGYFKSNPRAKLTATEQELYNQVLAHFSDEKYTLPNLEKGELQDDEKFWLSRECLLRYLRASKWKLNTAIERLEVTLKWRREYGMYDVLNASLVEPEAVTGKEILFGYDLKGKPAFYMIPSRQNTDGPPRQIQFAVWMLERCIDLMEPGVETIALLINFADRAKNPSIGTARAVLNILQEHYPERLGLALIINVPFLVNAFFKIVMPFVDPITREKVKFNPDVIKDGIFDQDMLMSKWWNGTKDFEYVHDKYWPELLKICDERATKWKKKWRELGATIGVSEWDYKEAGHSPSEEVEGGEEGDKKEDKVNGAKVTVIEQEDDNTPTIPTVVVDDTADEKNQYKAAQVPAKDQHNDSHVASTTHAETAVAHGVAGGAVATSGHGAQGGESGGASGGGDGGDAGGDGGGGE